MTEDAAAEEHGSYLQRTPYVFPAFSINGFACAQCGHTWYAMALIGTVGVECPNCHRLETRFVWTANPAEFKHDGAWLTAHWDLPVWTAPGPAEAGATCEEDDGIDPATGEHRFWLLRWAFRVRAAWWALKGEW